MMKLIDIKIGMAAWSKKNENELTWICSNIGRAGDGDIVLDFIESGEASTSIAAGSKFRMYLSEAMEYLTLNYFESAQYKELAS